MISLQDLLTRIDRGPGNEARAKQHLDAAIATFERRTGKRWRRATGLTREVDVPPEASYRRGPLFIEEPNALVTSVEEWYGGPSDAGVDELVEYVPATGVGSWRQVAKDTSIVQVIPVGHYWAEHVRLTYSCGYDSDANPLPAEYDDVREAIVSQAEFVMRRFSGEAGIFQTRTTEGATVNYLRGVLHPLFQEAVEQHQGKLL